jgi:hypothetical protein
MTSTRAGAWEDSRRHENTAIWRKVIRKMQTSAEATILLAGCPAPLEVVGMNN